MGSGDVDGGADCRVLPYVLCRKMKIKIVGVGKRVFSLDKMNLKMIDGSFEWY
jgi:hypothetical protein